jgi:hypothetical protein
MYGASYKVRHKEWFKECLALMVKTLPWIILFAMAVYGFSHISAEILKPSMNDKSPLGMIGGICLFMVFSLMIVFSPMLTASMIIIHKIDQGYKNDPVTLAYFILHDKQMWKAVFRADAKDFLGPALGMLTIVGLLIFSASMFGPDNQVAVEKTAVQIANVAFWNEHPFLGHVKGVLSLGGLIFMPYIIFHELKGRSCFNLFMLANSYKNVEECKIDAAAAKKSIGAMSFPYILGPQVALLLVDIVLNLDYPVIQLCVALLEFSVGVWSLHMHYIIGRDWYIGPPPKKQKQESLDSNMQTA